MIGVVHMYICMYVCMYVTKTKFEWHFSGRLIYSSTHGRFLLNLYNSSTTQGLIQGGPGGPDPITIVKK